MVRHSKIQIQVLGLYRQFMRAAQDRPGIADHIRSEFKKNMQLPRSDSLRIEFLMRRGQRQLDQLKTSTIKKMGVFQDNETKD